MQKFALAVVAMVASVASLGCGTIVNVAGDGERTPYGGTMVDVGCARGLPTGVGLGPPDQKFDRPTCLGLGLCSVADLPFSLLSRGRYADPPAYGASYSGKSSCERS